MKPLATGNPQPAVETSVPVLHDCRRAGEWVRHRATVTFRHVRLNSGQVRLEGVRCDGTPLHLICTRLPTGDLVANPHDTYERYLIERSGGVWVSVKAGPWEPLGGDGDAAEQPSLFGATS